MTAHPGTGDGLEVRVTGGVVRGVREGAMLAWRGMPYAAPPTGERAVQGAGAGASVARHP